jgi:hypothetical protein
VLVGGSTGTRGRQHRYSWEVAQVLVGGSRCHRGERQRISVGHLITKTRPCSGPSNIDVSDEQLPTFKALKKLYLRQM